MYDSMVTSSGGAQVLNDVEAAGAGDIGEFVDVGSQTLMPPADPTFTVE